MSNSARVRFARWGGVKISDPYHTFIGEGVVFDSLHPENIVIGEHVHITMGTIILTHYLDTKYSRVHWLSGGKVIFMDGCFIGANTIITKSVTVGMNSIVAAGSVVTKDIPDNEIWGGNPAHFIKKRNSEKTL